MTGFKDSFHRANYATKYRSYIPCQGCSSEQVAFCLNAVLDLPSFKTERDCAAGIGFADDLDARYRVGRAMRHQKKPPAPMVVRWRLA